MDAIICSAGKGTRLGALGLYRPKSMLRDVHTDKSILWYQLDALRAIGVERVFVMHNASDSQVPAEIARLHDRFPGMPMQCIPTATANIVQTIREALEHTPADRILRLDGDVCVLSLDGLAPVRDFYGSGLCCCEPRQCDRESQHTVYFDGSGIHYGAENGAAGPVWSCIDVWRRQDLELITQNASNDPGLLFRDLINQCLRDGLQMDTIMIEQVQEVDTPEDVLLLERAWDQLARQLSEKTLAYWTKQKDYPSFSVNKRAQLQIDEALVLERIAPGQHVLEIGAGPGNMVAFLLEKSGAASCQVVEPNPFWCRAIAERFSGNGRVRVFEGSLSAWNSSPEGADGDVDVALAFGWAPYIVHDDVLHRNLAALRARKLLLKAAEPPQDRFSRLLVNHFSQDLGAHYIALYRGMSEMASLLRYSGWCIREMRRNIYPESIDSRYGNRNYLLVAERP
ncbi:MAG: NTP transferase domain-containing protein [Candidatus Hydrogenedentota bacterium]